MTAADRETVRFISPFLLRKSWLAVLNAPCREMLGESSDRFEMLRSIQSEYLKRVEQLAHRASPFVLRAHLQIPAPF